jgi:biotin carboxyl carrier protein
MTPAFDVVVLHSDGARPLRVRVPRWLAWATLGLIAALSAAGAGFTAADGTTRRRQHGRIVALREQSDRQRELIETFRARVAAVRGELAEWETLHAKMWESFGPETSGSSETAGIGGPFVPEPVAPDTLGPEEEIEALASSVAEEGSRLRQLEHLVSRTGAIVSKLPLTWPVRGPVNSGYGLRRSPWTGRPEEHEGLDIGTLSGTPVQSPASGTVVTACAGGPFGRHVVLDHGNGVHSLYGHLSKIEVRAGEPVEKGQTIGLTGSSGRSTGPHLHYEILVEGKPMDPRGFLWPN